MRFSFVLIVVWLLVGCVENQTLLPGTFILSVAAGPKLLNQCSRSVPDGVSGYWNPSIEDVNYIDRNVDGYFYTEKTRGIRKLPRKNLDRYHRQYLGITVNGKRLIYGNFYYSKLIEPSDNETLEPEVICDGGNDYFGIVFDPVERKFLDVQFNGPYCEPRDSN